MNGEGSQLLMWTAELEGDGMVMVRGNVGSGKVSWGDGGGVQRFKWLVMAASMILTAVSSTAVIVGEGMGVVMVVMVKRKMSFLIILVLLLYVLGHSIGHRM